MTLLSQSNNVAIAFCVATTYVNLHYKYDYNIFRSKKEMKRALISILHKYDYTTFASNERLQKYSNVILYFFNRRGAETRRF